MRTNVLPKKYYTYIVKCSDGSYYTGKTIDLPKRLLQHNGELSGGAKYTRTRGPVTLVFYEEHQTNLFACRREAEIKRMPRIQKEKLITIRHLLIKHLLFLHFHYLHDN